MFCTKCGTNNEDNNAFCKNCGAKLVRSATNNSGVAQTHNSMNVIMITGVAVIAILVIVGLVFWKKGDSSKVASTTEVVQEDAISAEIPFQNPNQEDLDKSSVILDHDIDRETGTYTPGIYSSMILLENMSAELQITIDKHNISSIDLTNIDEDITTLYPLIYPTLEELSTAIISQQSVENIYSNNRYTSMLLMQAISEALTQANENNERGKFGDLDFTVVGEKKQPDSLKEIIAEESEEPFQLIYMLGEEDLYIVIGYGKQPSGGYSISVKEFYETIDTIVVKTTLIAPGEGQHVTDVHTMPYIVIKTVNTDKKIEFE